MIDGVIFTALEPKSIHLKKSILIPILLVFIFSCSPDEETQAPTNTVQTLQPEPEPVYSSSATNLNVVYFIPSNKDTLENYQKRISGIILHTQAWFKKEMDRNGFGEKTFGLLTNNEQKQSENYLFNRKV